jgi:hypothetical protein
VSASERLRVHTASELRVYAGAPPHPRRAGAPPCSRRAGAPPRPRRAGAPPSTPRSSLHAPTTELCVHVASFSARALDWYCGAWDD